MSATPGGPGRPAQVPGDVATAAQARRARLRAAAAAHGVPLATILVSVAVVVLTYLAGKLAYRLRDVILMIVAAGFLALILNPLVVALQRWRIRRRGQAVAVVTIWTVLVFAGLVAAFGYPLAHGLTHFSQRLPSDVAAAEHGRGWIGQLVRRFHLQEWITRNAPKLQSLGVTLARPALTVGKGAVSLLATLGTIFALLVLFLLEGPKMGRWLLDLMPPGRAAYCRRVAGEISQSVTGYAFGNLLTSLIAGLVVFVTLTVLGVPFPLLWALWVALVDFLPMIGGALAGIPTVLFALGHSLTAGIVTAAAFIAYQQIENHVLNPVVMSRTVKINPLLVLLSILVGTSIGSWLGGSFGSFVAALLSIPVAGALQVIVRELWQITGRPERAEGEQAAGPQPSITDQQKSGPHRELYDGGRQADEDIAAPQPDATRPGSTRRPKPFPRRSRSPRWHPSSTTSGSRRDARPIARTNITRAAIAFIFTRLRGGLLISGRSAAISAQEGPQEMGKTTDIREAAEAELKFDPLVDDEVSGQIDPPLRVEGRPGARSNGGLAVNGT
jgi:predicted PurR-regulated permease PerM